MGGCTDSLVPGAGLTVEQRKRLTIGVELAAKPTILLFLDEPTSGLDGQSAFNVVRFLKRLTAAGQAVLVSRNFVICIIFLLTVDSVPFISLLHPCLNHSTPCYSWLKEGKRYTLAKVSKFLILDWIFR